MLRSYLAVALRHLLTQRLYSAINVVGLAVGLACFILIALLVQHELSYDSYHSKAERVFRISRDFYTPGLPEVYAAGTPPVIAPLLKQDFSQIERAARISRCGGGTLVSNGDRSFLEPEFAAADSEIFDILDFEWLHGGPADALAAPYTIVLTESTARKYFGAENPLGQTLIIENEQPVEVTGVVRDLPDNTHLRFDMLVSMGYVAATNDENFLQVWNMNCYYTYVQLRQGAEIAEVQNQSAEFFERHAGEGSSGANDFTAVPLTDIHLRSPRAFDMRPPGSMSTVYAFSAIAAFILLIACINFMNLATARATQRAKEVGVRKVVGAGRTKVIVQFLGESMLLASIGMLLALALVELLLPAFGNFVQKDLNLEYLGDPPALVLLVLLTLLVGLAAGSYPAFYLSAFKPARVLKGDVTRGSGAATFRKALVVLQFSISIALVIATAIVYQQMLFVRNIDLGYDKDQIIVVSGSLTEGLGSQWEALKREWLVHPQITQATASFQIPGSSLGNSFRVHVEGGEPEGRAIPVVFVDYGFFETYDIDVLSGRTFSQDFASERMRAPGLGDPTTTAGFIINALAAREFGWTPEEAIGKTFETEGPAGAQGRIVGVVADVHFESVHSPIVPAVFVLSPERMIGRSFLSIASIRITGRDISGTLEHIDTTWAKFVPDQPVTRRFLDQDFQALYQAEERQGRMFAYFSLLAIFIACLGLFGLALFTATRRTKEIGVRKVMGGTVWDVVRLFTSEFGKLVLLANLIAWPVAYFAMQRWLASFAYRIEIGLWVFVGSALIALVIAWLTVGAVAARASGLKPIHALRYE